MIQVERIETTLLQESPISCSIVLPQNCKKVCLWLHGFQERSQEILQSVDLEFFGERYQTAFLLPDVPDTYYLNQPWNACYTEQFLITELLPALQRKYESVTGAACWKHLEIAGISMGGFGSLLLGSHFPDHFQKIICISGAFILSDLLIGNPEVTGTFLGNLEYFQNLFGCLDTLETSYSRNPAVAAAYQLEKKQLPPVFMACGTEDMLYRRNLRLRDQLREAGANLTWKEARGGHNWKFFSSILEDAWKG